MGQYYVIANPDRKEYISPDGIKLMEHSWLGNESCSLVGELLRDKWKGDRVLWVGDYTEDDEFTLWEEDGIEYDRNLYDYACKNYRQLKTIEGAPNTAWIVANDDKKEYVDLTDLPESDYGKVYPVSILTATSNGRGGGDYRHNGENGDEEFDGHWAGDHLSAYETLDELLNEKDGFEQIQPDFYERY